jgi:hypothetical protein
MIQLVYFGVILVTVDWKIIHFSFQYNCVSAHAAETSLKVLRNIIGKCVRITLLPEISFSRCCNNTVNMFIKAKF